LRQSLGPVGRDCRGNHVAQGVISPEGAAHGAVEVAVVGVGSGFGRGGEGAGTDLDVGVERGAGVGGDGVRFNVFVGDGDLRSG
jgi:hypothetical protein